MTHENPAAAGAGPEPRVPAPLRPRRRRDKAAAIRLLVGLRLHRDAAREITPYLVEHRRRNGGTCCSGPCLTCYLWDQFSLDALLEGRLTEIDNLSELVRSVSSLIGPPPPLGDQLLLLCEEVQRMAGRLGARLRRHSCPLGGGPCPECRLLAALGELVQDLDARAGEVFVLLSPPPAVSPPAPPRSPAAPSRPSTRKGEKRHD